MKKAFLVFAFILPLIVTAQTSVINTYAGNGTTGYSGDGGPASIASIFFAFVAIDSLKNIYITDYEHEVIRKIDNTGIITTIAGIGSSGFSGDGGIATLAQFKAPIGIAVDRAGNIFICDEMNSVIRKINCLGIISTIAGDGTWAFDGDGGPAITAHLEDPFAIALDSWGNIYFSDAGTNTIRKIDTSGIIHTVAGTFGTYGFSGDGGPATMAQLNSPWGITIDDQGNIYFCDVNNSRIRKINTAGIISTICGNGIVGYTGDGDSATLAEISDHAACLSRDSFGNIYFGDAGNNVVRKINTSGIITTIAGNGIAGHTGDGGGALSARMDHPQAICMDKARNLFITETGSYLRKISIFPDITADSFSVYFDKLCGGVQFGVETHALSATNIRIFYGDGSSDTGILTLTGVHVKTANVIHSYSLPGNYTIRMIMLNGATPIDSVTYSYDFLLCNTFSIEFYNDANGNCIRDTGEIFNYRPFTVVVDSNGIAIDTMSVTSGVHYTAYGNPGDIYKFHVLSSYLGWGVSCPAGGVITDTLRSAINNFDRKYVGLSCISSPGFDFSEEVSTRAGRHAFLGEIVIRNAYCTPHADSLTVNFSPKYSFVDANITPSYVSGNTLKWYLPELSAAIQQQLIYFYCNVAGPLLSLGDTVNSDYTVSPTLWDVNPVDNHCTKSDSVRASFDPNEMSVTPQGYITSGTQLQYTINFENTGNDTARNIYVMDTLSDNEMPTSMRMVESSAVMNMIPIKAGGHNIIKFDFPNIKLPDSSHHNQCNGMLMFTINARAGLPDGTLIPNHAGIFFDDNPVVMTDTVVNTIGHPSLAVTAVPVMQAELFPNPATDVLTIKADPAYYSSCAITNIIGAEVLIQPLLAAQTSVDIKTLQPGIYYVRLSGDGVTVVKKFVKM